MATMHVADFKVAHRFETRADGLPGNMTVSVEHQPSVFVQFRDGLPAIETLEILKSQVSQTLDAFQPEFE
jgi:hypothetical protein